MIDSSDIKSARILIVDDQPVNVELLEFLLGASGYTDVSSTTDPRQVAVLHGSQRYDLIILDLQMPGMSGFDVMEALRPLESASWLPVLVVTAEPEQKVAALEAGARDFVSKPFDPVEVLTRIRNMLEVRLLHQESISYGATLERTVRERTAELQRFRSAMDATADAIFLIGAADMAVVDVNDGACRMLGYSRAALLRLDPPQLGLASAAQLQRLARLDGGAGAATELAEAELARQDGVAVPVEITWQRQPGQGAPVLIGVARDISERLIAQRSLRHMASYDSLTGLPNRTLFYRTLGETIELARDKGWRIAVMFITLDRFKVINDTLGAASGDELLRQFSSRLVKCAPQRDTAGRLGGDEFALTVTAARTEQDVVQVANELREALRLPFELEGGEAGLTASIGIAMYPDDATEPEALVRNAEKAMERAKEAGRDGYRFFTSAMNVQVLARLDLELALRRAFEDEQFLLHYQPKVKLDTGRIGGVEALLRWQRPGHGLVFPAEFVSVMEQTGMIVRVGEWIIDSACRQIAAWIADGTGAVRVAVNVSSRQFVEGDLEASVVAALERHAVDAHLLELELTESALMSNADHTIAVLGKLRARGIRIAIDDFGTGYSSLAYLKRFPIDKLKIDIAFVRDVTVNPDDAAIALAIIGMAHSLKMDVVAEGVETPAQMSYLRRNRCDEVQGFHFSRALPALELSRLYKVNSKRPVQVESSADKRQTLLLVDADVAALGALYRLFRHDSYRVLTASAPAEAFDLLALNTVQVIVCDQRLPVISGTEFLSKVKEMYPDTIRIILSAETGLAAVLDAINRGAIYRFYTKPWDDAELRDNVHLAFHHYWLANAPREAASEPLVQPS